MWSARFSQPSKGTSRSRASETSISPATAGIAAAMIYTPHLLFPAHPYTTDQLQMSRRVHRKARCIPGPFADHDHAVPKRTMSTDHTTTNIHPGGRYQTRLPASSLMGHRRDGPNAAPTDTRMSTSVLSIICFIFVSVQNKMGNRTVRSRVGAGFAGAAAGGATGYLTGMAYAVAQTDTWVRRNCVEIKATDGIGQGIEKAKRDNPSLSNKRLWLLYEKIGPTWHTAFYDSERKTRFDILMGDGIYGIYVEKGRTSDEETMLYTKPFKDEAEAHKTWTEKIDQLDKLMAGKKYLRRSDLSAEPKKLATFDRLLNVSAATRLYDRIRNTRLGGNASGQAVIIANMVLMHALCEQLVPVEAVLWKNAARTANWSGAGGAVFGAISGVLLKIYAKYRKRKKKRKNRQKRKKKK